MDERTRAYFNRLLLQRIGRIRARICVYIFFLMFSQLLICVYVFKQFFSSLFCSCIGFSSEYSHSGHWCDDGAHKICKKIFFFIIIETTEKICLKCENGKLLTLRKRTSETWNANFDYIVFWCAYWTFDLIRYSILIFLNYDERAFICL